LLPPGTILIGAVSNVRRLHPRREAAVAGRRSCEIGLQILQIATWRDEDIRPPGRSPSTRGSPTRFRGPPAMADQRGRASWPLPAPKSGQSGSSRFHTGRWVGHRKTIGPWRGDSEVRFDPSAGDPWVKHPRIIRFSWPVTIGISREPAIRISRSGKRRPKKSVRPRIVYRDLEERQEYAGSGTWGEKKKETAEVEIGGK